MTLTLKHITGTDQKALDAAIARFKKIEPNIKIKASFAPTDQLQTSLRAQLGGGNAPDHVRRLAGQRLRDGGPAARPDRRAGGPLGRRAGSSTVPTEPAPAARRQGQDVHVVARA